MKKNEQDKHVDRNISDDLTTEEKPVQPTIHEKNYSIDRHEKTVKVKGKSFMKPVIITVFSALLIGSVLGFFMLNVFTNLGEKVSGDDQEIANAHADRQDKEDHETSLVTLQEMAAYVTQGGVFSEAANAEEWAKKYEQAGFPSVIFAQDDQYFLLVGIADKENIANEFAENLKDKQFEVYVKEWKSEQEKVELTAEEEHWMTSFQSQWQDTLKSVATKEEVSLDGWSDLTNSHPLQSEMVLQLVEKIHEFYDEGADDLDHLKWQEMLLSVWKTYEDVLPVGNAE